MQLSIAFVRLVFVMLSVFFFTAYASNSTTDNNPWVLIIGISVGLIFAGFVIGLDFFCKKFNLRSFNLAALGLFLGYLMAEAVVTLLNSALRAQILVLPQEAATLAKIAIYLFTAYFGMVLTARASDELYMSIPFIRFKRTQQKRRDILLDLSILSDPRLIDLANSGLLDQQLLVPRFALLDLQIQSENDDENIKAKAKKCLETLKKLESLPELELRYVDDNSLDLKDYQAKLNYLARQLDANILTADINKIQQSEIEGLKVININFLSHALKPLTSAGEFIHIKIQRYGKEPRQGVGYLDDGTMVVVNGAAEFIGASVKAVVLSIKHTASGRMIFCNACEEGAEKESCDLENSPHSYFAV